MSDRLPARVEASALIRQAESNGGFGTILKRGDPDSGALVLLIAQKGVPIALVERQMGQDFAYRWTATESGESLRGNKFRDSLADRARFDPDFWLIELDIPDAERFIAETTSCS
ncbi:MAG: DUF1491 family protein [Sphingomicrobium sp.]